MKKILLGLVFTAIALILFVSLKPYIAGLLVMPEIPTVDLSQEAIILEPAPYFTTVQGGSEPALIVRNNTNEIISFSLGHEHPHLYFQPQGDRISPGGSREIAVFIDPLCPVGEISIPVYLRSEIGGERVGKETVVVLSVLPGELTIGSENYKLIVSWNNNEPAPRGTEVYYRPIGSEEWRLWGETPRIDPPAALAPGIYELEFTAVLGAISSAITTLEIVVEEPPAPKKKLEPETEGLTAGPVVEQKEDKPEPEPVLEPPNPGTMAYIAWYSATGAAPGTFEAAVLEWYNEYTNQKTDLNYEKWKAEKEKKKAEDTKGFWELDF